MLQQQGCYGSSLAQLSQPRWQVRSFWNPVTIVQQKSKIREKASYYPVGLHHIPRLQSAMKFPRSWSVWGLVPDARLSSEF